MRSNLARSLLGGFIGTVVLTIMMYAVAPVMTGQKMDIAAMLGGMMAHSRTLGMIVHFVLGTIGFPLIYTLLVYRLAGGPPVVKGMIWGGILWLAAQVIVMPMAGAGFFSSAAGGMKAAVASLLGHLVYGMILGGITGRIDSRAEAKV